MRPFIAFAFFFLLAGQALSLSIAVGGSLGTIDASQFLNVTDTYLLTDCQSQCSNATTQIANCTSDACLCASNTVVAITSCQQCMFNDLISKFATTTDPRSGSSTALTAYAAACSSVGIVVPASDVTLTLPSDWDGPVGVHLGTCLTAVVVGMTGILGFSALVLMSNM
ncbi:hypothetical protein K503DRAFT_768290 [Rhizopogon vinicolor AM-OR11-026]|uniref:Extracellular membrane protein CFEM domain-containing protein n=1 Tax=Rhizopogon vinicolor AM-OR11-026 TaxID=1314800 RepID=A0A1B7N7A9_9AGAM|nr:hypothetical protein K503DRAFT_768290 [Rhizopogon vinicolor AM-OR11-026]